MHMLNDVVRSELHDMINYYIDTQYGFNLSTGKDGKYFKKYLPHELYVQYTATYSGSDYVEIWSAVEVMCNLFHTLAMTVAAHFNFTYRQEEEAEQHDFPAICTLMKNELGYSDLNDAEEINRLRYFSGNKD